MILFPDLPEVVIEQVHVTDEITLTLRTTCPTASCPSCGTASSRIQSRYTRALHDLPASGRPVRLIVHVRRFFCSKSTCPQKIFAERLAHLCLPHAQRTIRLQEALSQLGLVVGGQVGAHVGSELGLSGSRDTILRLLRQRPLPELPEPRIVGLDDWAWKRRRRYGTLICDLERGLPIEVLPDRSVETVSVWLQAHPSIAIVSRDGSSEYASAITKGAPQARQVSDRWHVTKNLASCVSVILAQCLTEIRRTAHSSLSAQQETTTVQGGRPARTRAVQQTQQARQEERQHRYQTILALRSQGMKSQEIAVRVGIGERTVRHWLSRRGLPYSRPRNPRPRLIDAYAAYLALRWQAGCHNGSQLEKEVRARGYTGSQRGIYRYLETLEASADLSVPPRSAAPPAEAGTPSNLPLTLSPQQATWLFFRRKADLKQEELTQLRVLLQASDRAQTTYHLVEQFLHMVRECAGEQLDAWLQEVKASQLVAFTSFVTSIQQDQDAILAGLTLPWSTGPLEGHINRLKLIKRQGYGRAKFDLLRLRVLHHRQKNQGEKTKLNQQHEGGSSQNPKTGENSTNFRHTTFAISEAA
ncbi:MAG: ISL3 family transposase [Ktedonobacteraceae bacterium]|nr:ISL3 family transposase [Ktedonobacteraceae bacterium]